MPIGSFQALKHQAVDMHIAKLRKKLGDGIATVRGEGYRLDA